MKYIVTLYLLLALAPAQGFAQQAKDTSVFPIREDGFLDLERLKTWDPKKAGVLDSDEQLVAAVRELGQLLKVITRVVIIQEENESTKFENVTTFDVRCEQLNGLLTLCETLAKHPSQRSVLLSHAVSACVSVAVLRSFPLFRHEDFWLIFGKDFSGGKPKNDLALDLVAIAQKTSELTQALRDEVIKQFVTDKPILAVQTSFLGNNGEVIKQFVTDQPRIWNELVPLLVKEAEKESSKRAEAKHDPQLLIKHRASGLDLGEKGLKALAEFDEIPFNQLFEDKSKTLALKYCVAVDGLAYKLNVFCLKAIHKSPKDDAVWKNIMPYDEAEPWGGISELDKAMTVDEKDRTTSSKFLRVNGKKKPASDK